MRPGCEVIIEKYESIQSSLRISWTLQEFYANGGATSFVNNLGASLGIHPSTIKVVAVWEGSVNVQYEIQSGTNDTAELSQIETTLKAKIVDGTLNVGAEILDATITDIPVNFGNNG